MRIPPLYRSPSWQRFLAGVAVGGFISWFIFLYIHGVWLEEKSTEIRKQEEEIEKLKKDIVIWQEEFQELNKKNQEKLTIQKMKVKVINWEKYKLDTFSVFEIEEGVKDDINMLLAKDLETVFKSRDLIKRTIENKTVKVNDKKYKLEVKEVFIYTTLYIHIELHLD